LLLVEDDYLDAAITKRCLKQLDIQCELVHKTDGETALEYLRDCQADLPWAILLDLNMPRMSGLEFLARIKTDPSLENIPILIVTTSCLPEDRHACLKLGAVEYVVKDCNWNTFNERMKCVTKYRDLVAVQSVATTGRAG
jgi:CheY-like chemotaxis protein